MESLIRGLSSNNLGLCILTTREPVAEVAYLSSTTAPRIDLEHLSPEAGALLLKKLKVKGTNEELQEASQAFAGHALALTLLGTYLSEVHNGDVRHWKEVPLLDEDAPQGGHARRVMQSYQKWLGEGPEYLLLQLMGFFDRPAKGAEIQALLAEPPIEGITDSILKLDQPSRKRALSRLRRLRLLVEPTPDDPNGMDAFPLLREYLSGQLQKDHPESYREGHRRLYEHLKQTARELPETLEEMMPLYQAVAHGCRAGMHKESLRDVYWQRLDRGSEAFQIFKLGAFGAALAAVSNFFESPWHQPSTKLVEEERTFVLQAAGFQLYALNRLSEAVAPMRAALEAAKSMRDWANAARYAGNLSGLRLAIGDLPEAEKDARHAINLADRGGGRFEKILSRTALGYVLHQSGRIAQASSAFQEAEQIQKEQLPDHPLLFSLYGFQSCDFLLGECELLAWKPQSNLGFYLTALRQLVLRLIRKCGVRGVRKGKPVMASERGSSLSRSNAVSRCRQVRRRAYRTLNWAEKPQQEIVSAAFDHLILGRSFLLEAALGAPFRHLLSRTQNHLICAAKGLREAGIQQYQPLGFIAHAQLHRLQFQRTRKDSFASQAQQNLDKAAHIASRGPMPLFQADIALEQSRLHHAQGHLDQARQSLSKARTLIQKHAYHRRDPELEAMEELLKE